MTGVATAIGVGVAGIAAGAYESSQASSAQQSAAQGAENTQMSMFNQIQANEAPWVTSGKQANSALASFYGLGGAGGATPNYSAILSNLPGYQFQLQQGTQAVDRNLAAQGLLQSGAAGKELQQYGQGLAQSYAGQYTQGLQNLSQMGQAAAGGQATAGMNAANNVSSSQIYAGNAAAGGAIGTANAIGGGLNNGLMGYGLYSSYQNSLNNGGANGYVPGVNYNPGSNYTFDSGGNVIGQGAAAGQGATPFAGGGGLAYGAGYDPTAWTGLT